MVCLLHSRFPRFWGIRRLSNHSFFCMNPESPLYLNDALPSEENAHSQSLFW